MLLTKQRERKDGKSSQKEFLVWKMKLPILPKKSILAHCVGTVLLETTSSPLFKISSTGSPGVV